ncbi:MAG: hypothetical protein H7145_17450 [Akkermansiaceae bacterium]|nr:hypothetical protein [Armatimonadota bacterium]
MYFGIGDAHSVILTSVRPNAPYDDRFEDDGSTLIYEGHNEPRDAAFPNPGLFDEPSFSTSRVPTQNGKFYEVAQRYKQGRRPAERVRVYEKVQPGVWSYNGVFDLVDSWREQVGERSIYKFRLVSIGDEPASTETDHSSSHL